MRQNNWGRWGKDDERGLANLLQGENVVDACHRVKNGRIYNLGISVRQGAPVAGHRMSPMHFMSIDGGDFAARGLEDRGGAEDYITLCTHGTTHIDALSHYWYGGEMYNGFSYKEVRSSGAAKCAIDKTRALVTRAHLLDFVATRPADASLIHLKDIRAYLERAGIKVKPGDALLFRTGWMEAALKKQHTGRIFPAVAPDVAGWVAENDISILGADNEAVEHIAESMPLHEIMLRDLGGYLMELLTLEEAAQDGVVSGLLVVAPLLISRGVGSPLNPVLIT